MKVVQFKADQDLIDRFDYILKREGADRSKKIRLFIEDYVNSWWKKNVFKKYGVDWGEVAKEIEAKSHDRVEILVFADGTVTAVSGTWVAQKEIALRLEKGKWTKEKALEALRERILYGTTPKD